MDILIIAEKKARAEPFVNALLKRHVHAKYLRVSKITLVSKQKETQIKTLGKEIHKADGVFIITRASLAQFIEPMLEELQNRKIYCTAKKGSYYIALNEPYQFVTLAIGGIPTPKTIMSGSAKNLENISKKVSYPLIAKTFIAKKAQQALVVNNGKELKGFIKSIKAEIDGFMLKEFIEADTISCAVVGKKVFAIRRKQNAGEISDLAQGKPYKPSEAEEKTAISAAITCGLDIARVDLSKGKVTKVEPTFNLEAFNNITSEHIEDHVAEFLIDKAEEQHEDIRKLSYDLLGIKKIISKTILGRFFK
jgi:glutathione synthase/RimK-type ligase-like ATP-grasp enzyme